MDLLLFCQTVAAQWVTGSVLLPTLWAAFHDSGATLTGRLLSLLLCFVVFKFDLYVVEKILFTRRAYIIGSGTAVAIQHKDPILGIDAFLKGLAALREFRLPQHFSALFERHGQTYYSKALGRWILMTNEPENIKTVLGTNMPDWPIDGPRLFAALPVLGPRSIFTTNGQEWHAARTMMRPAFVRDQVSDLECFGRHTDNFLTLIPRDGSTFDIQELLLHLTMDSSTDFLLGHSTNLLVYASPEALQFYRDFEYASAEAAVRSRLGPILHYLPHPKLKKAVRRLRQYIRTYLRKVADKGPSETKDRSYVFIDELLKLKPTEDYVTDQVLSVIVAGRDTTASGLSAVFYCLARHPEAVKRLKREMEELGVEDPTWEQLKQMKYLNNVIKEGEFPAYIPRPSVLVSHFTTAMRLFPPISTNSRTSNKETLLPVGGGPDGREPLLIAKGTSLRWSSYSLHRRKDIYGADADEFRPERWESNLRVRYVPPSGVWAGVLSGV